MTYNLTNPKLLLRFEGNDLEPGHGLVQTIESDFIYNRSFSGRFLRLSQMKSSSDQISLQIKRLCPSIEDIIATEGNIKAVLKDGEETVFTGYLSTSWKWSVTDHGERALAVTVEGVGTRLLNQPFIETGKHFFRCSASAAIYAIVYPLGITIHAGDERKVLQDVSKDVSAGTTRRELLDQLLYECNAYYWFDNLGEMRIDLISPQTTGAPVLDSSDLYNVFRESVTLSKNLRSYKGARVKYSVLGEADNYLVYRNTTGQDSSHPYCNLELKAGEYFDGTEIYSAAEWAEAQADEFREPALIGAVNADSESQIVGSNKIVNIENLQPEVVGAGMTCVFENVGGGYFKLTAHNTSGGARQFTRMDLYASIVYEKSQGVVRTQIDGSSAGKTLIEESLEWIHDKDNASAHANLVSQYHQKANASYTFWAKAEIMPGTVIRLNENLYSGLDVYVLVIGYEVSAGVDCYKYTAVGISTFDLTEPTYHGTSQPANQSGAQGPAGEPGKAAEVQYAIGDSIVDPPADEMLWNSVTMEWDGDPMLWQVGLWGDEVPEMERGKYIWMRTRVGDAPWQYTRLTGSTSWDAENLGIATTETPKTSKDNLNLIPGDYFVAGVQFTEDGVTYKQGYVYDYDGTTWRVMDLSNPSNAEKGWDILASLMSSGINVTDSTASIYAWIGYLVAQTAVIDQLIARKLQVGLGDDSTGFYLKIEDGTPPVIVCKFNGNILWRIDATTGQMYGNFAQVRQYMPFQFDDSLDSTYPMECDFYIPSNATIVSIKLSSKGKKYRAYSKATNSAGGTISSGVINFWGPQGSGPTTAPDISVTATKIGILDSHTGDAGGHKHSYDKTTGIGGLLGDGAHTHGLYKPAISNAYTEYANPDYHRHGVVIPTQTGNSFGQADGAHSHTAQTTSTDTSSVADHQHSIPGDLVTGVSLTVNKLRESDLEHKHSVDISHGHDLTFGIYEGTTPAGVELFCSNDGSSYGSAISGASSSANNSNFDITSQFSGTGWKSIKFTSTQLGRIQAQLIVELLVNT